MEKQDLVEGLRNSVKRGYSFEEAMQSFINAGYPEQNVRDSAKLIGEGVLKTEEKAISLEHDDEARPEEKKLETPAPEAKEELGAGGKVQKKSNKKIIILSIILALLIIIGAVGFIFRAKLFS